MSKVKICERCVMDSTDTLLKFNKDGVCERCIEFDNRIANWWDFGNGHEQELNAILETIKKAGKGKKYDSILGLSGGLDSSYLLHMAVAKWGLRPFIFHVDAGWNLPVAEENIRKICDKLNLELHVEKIDFEDMRQMQIAFFKTGHAGLDAPQDHAFIAQVDKFAQKLGVKYILNGYNISSEIVANPTSWYEGAGQTADDVYIKDVLRKHGGYKTKNYIYTSGFKHKFWLPYVKGVKTVHLLNYVPCAKSKMIETLVSEYGYIPYPQKHFENLLTKFIEGWWLPSRFGLDIRKAQLSSLILTGQMTREEALKILEQPPLTEEESKQLFSMVAEKLQISEEELMQYHDQPKVYKKYKNKSWAFDIGIKIFTLLGLDKRIRK
ncbi:MAG: N-acetyl sugar amidotransferase [Clostridia bacterium]|nr:N-acetyl sugar amidotransferase [Clostridia bacterium]